MPNIRKFAFIVYPLSVDSFFFCFPALNFLRKLHFLSFKKFISRLPSFTYINNIKIISRLGVGVSGSVIMCPLLPEHFVTLSPTIVVGRILKACKKAEANGVSVIGLAGFTSIFTDQGVSVASELHAAVTTGNSLTANMAIRGILKAASILNVNLSKSTLAVIGATGDIGSVCSRVLGGKFGNLLLVARDKTRLEKFAVELGVSQSINVGITADLETAVRNSDFVLITTSAITTIINPSWIKSGAVVCDVSLPANIAREIIKYRTDVLLFEGGYVTIPNFELLPNLFKKHFPQNAIYGCLAETIVLALENRLENYSIGRGNITPERVNEIGEMAQRHGFEQAPFFCGQKIYTDGDFQIIKKYLRI